jgi:thioredoxin-like negative regulator of GroEL
LAFGLFFNKTKNGKKEKMPEVTTLDELNAVLRKSFPQLVLLKATAPWCRPCKVVQATLERLIEKWKEAVPVLLVTYNVDIAAELVEAFRISSVPTMHFLLPEKTKEFSESQLQFVGADQRIIPWFERVVRRYVQRTEQLAEEETIPVDVPADFHVDIGDEQIDVRLEK